MRSQFYRQPSSTDHFLKQIVCDLSTVQYCKILSYVIGKVFLSLCAMTIQMCPEQSALVDPALRWGAGLDNFQRLPPTLRVLDSVIHRHRHLYEMASWFYLHFHFFCQHRDNCFIDCHAKGKAVQMKIKYLSHLLSQNVLPASFHPSHIDWLAKRW